MTKHTIQFPIPLLAFGETPEFRLNVVLSYAMVATGKRQRDKLTKEQMTARLANHPPIKDTAGATAHDVETIRLGEEYCGLSSNCARATLGRYREAMAFLERWEQRGRTCPQVRISKDLVFEARDGGGISYGDFAALCAVYAALGQKPYFRVTQPRIRAGAMGYSSGKWLFDASGNISKDGELTLSERDDKAKPDSKKEIRTRLDRLERKGLLKRFNDRSWMTYFSRDMSAEQIAERILARVTATAKKKTRLQELREQIQAVRQSHGQPDGRGDLMEGQHNSLTDPTEPAESGATSGQLVGDVGATDGQQIGQPRGNIMLPCNATLNATQNATCQMLPLNASASAFDPVSVSEVEHQPPTLEAAKEFAKSLIKGSAKLGAEWFKAHGDDPQWTTKDWRKGYTRWITKRQQEERTR